MHDEFVPYEIDVAQPDGVEIETWHLNDPYLDYLGIAQFRTRKTRAGRSKTWMGRSGARTGDGKLECRFWIESWPNAATRSNGWIDCADRHSALANATRCFKSDSNLGKHFKSTKWTRVLSDNEKRQREMAEQVMVELDAL